MTINAKDIERVLTEGQQAVDLTRDLKVPCPYEDGTWERAVFHEGVNRQLASWLIADYKMAHDQYCVALNKFREFYPALRDLMKMMNEPHDY
jgi:hypothetical protein